MSELHFLSQEETERRNAELSTRIEECNRRGYHRDGKIRVYPVFERDSSRTGSGYICEDCGFSGFRSMTEEESRGYRKIFTEPLGAAA